MKDQFEVVPKKDLLILEGFVPPPEGHELELADLTPLESTNGNTPRSGVKGGTVATSAAKGNSSAGPPAAPGVVNKPVPSSTTRAGGKIHPVKEDIES